MKKNYLILIISLFTVNVFATQFTVTPTGNLTYSPMITNATVGDTVHELFPGDYFAISFGKKQKYLSSQSYYHYTAIIICFLNIFTKQSKIKYYVKIK